MIEVKAKDIFGELEMQQGDYLNKFSNYPRKSQ